MPEPTRRLIPVSGGDLLVGRWGGGDRVVLAIHGGTGSHLVWGPVTDHLVPDISVVAPDLRGAAAGVDLPGPFGMAAHADDLVAVIDHLGIERCTLAGWSLGGFVAAFTAHRHPDRFDGVVLVDGGVAHPLPSDVEPEAIVETYVEPAVAQLSATFPTEEAYLDGWRAHPAFVGNWSPAIETMLRYVMAGEAPAVRSRSSLDAMRVDVADTLLDAETRRAALELPMPTTFVRCERGVLDEPAGYYSWPGFEDVLADAGIDLVDVAGVNHWMLMYAEPGAGLVADAIRAMATGARTR